MRLLIVIFVLLLGCSKPEIGFCEIVDNNDIKNIELLVNKNSKNIKQWLESQQCVESVYEIAPIKTLPITYVYKIKFINIGEKILYIQNNKFIRYEHIHPK